MHINHALGGIVRVGNIGDTEVFVISMLSVDLTYFEPAAARNYINSISPQRDPLQAGKVLVSPSESHFALTAKHRVVLLPVNPNDTYHPSCDVLLDSVAKVFGSLAVGIILTGMGMDGVAGIAKIHRTQGRTIAQNEASSLIYGMNRAAIESGTVQQVLTLEDIVPAMLDIAHSRSSYDA